MTSSNMHILTNRAILYERSYPNCRKPSLKTKDKEPILKTNQHKTLTNLRYIFCSAKSN